MYIRPVHAELDIPTLQEFVETHPLGLFTTAIPSERYDTLQTTHVPFILEVPSSSSFSSNDNGHLGTLKGHMARQNPQAKALIETLRPNDTQILEQDVLVLFNAPAHHYVSPRFYTETKPTDGKVVPTWNYAAVQVYGRLMVHYANNDTTSAFLQSQMEALTSYSESNNRDPGGKGQWKVADAPERYVELMKKGVIGLEIEIKKMEGRFKLSQEATNGDWNGVVEGFKGLGTEKAQQMAEMIEKRGKDRSLDPSQVHAGAE